MNENSVFLCTNGDCIYEYTQEFGWERKINSGIRQWRSIDSDDFGVDIYACAWKDYIYQSTNLGDTWVPVTASIGRQSWTAISCDSNASTIVACATWSDTNPKGGYVWISRDFGDTWNIASKKIGIHEDGISLWSSVAVNDDGIVIVAIELYGSIWISRDNGVSWGNPVTTDPVFYYIFSNFVDVCISGNGEKIAVISTPTKLDAGCVYSSEDSGKTWYRFILAQKSDCIACSTDGTLIAVGTNANFIYTSKNSGFSFNEQFGSRRQNWATVTISPDNKLFIGASYNGYVYQSKDGSIWNMITDSPSNQWLDSCITNNKDPPEVRIKKRNANIQKSKLRKKSKMITPKK